MSEMRETCGCGAVWEGHSAYKSEREKFRAAHAPCRRPLRTEQGEEERLREALREISRGVAVTKARRIALAALSQDTEERCERCSDTGRFFPRPLKNGPTATTTIPCPDCTGKKPPHGEEER